ncbi:hypothetical protein B0T21DRAFT_61331 [Apiosordaria backusii]|uniref:Uncharacterized protein n=1 Tax=Apiosordaria backusii TaxID=314023 RepID=A0AA40DU42_9PEZI|nr:hypothetical protein B0T21DRAFT_61331 [Apiosordaria backusii]
MPSPTATRPGRFLVRRDSRQPSVSSTSESEANDFVSLTLPRRYSLPQQSPSPPPARKRVVFSSENLRYNKMVLKQARERSRVRGSRSRSPSKQRQEECHDRNPPKGKVQFQRPSKSPAAVGFQSGASVGIRGGSTTSRVELGTGIHRQQQSRGGEQLEYSSESISKKRTLDAPPETFPSPKRRSLGHVSRSPSPRVAHRSYEHGTLDDRRWMHQSPSMPLQEGRPFINSIPHNDSGLRQARA